MLLVDMSSPTPDHLQEPDKVLVWAIDNGNTLVAKSSLVAGANPNYIPKSSAPLFLAIKHERVSIIELLLAREDIDADCQNRCKDTPLICAAERGLEVAFELLIARDDVDVNHKGLFDTPLTAAASKGYTRIVELLLARKDIELNKPNYTGSTPLIRAVHQGHGEIVQILVSRHDVDVNIEDELGETALILAVTTGATQIVRQLLGRGDIRPNLAAGDKRMTALHEAVAASHVEIIELLVQREDIDLECISSTNQSPLLLSLAFEEFFLLIGEERAIGMDEGYCTTLGLNLFDTEYYKIIELLLKARADPNREVGNWTPLLEASSAQAIELLLYAGADPNGHGGIMLTPLIKAILSENEEGVRLLLRGGADPNRIGSDEISNDEKWEPLSFAARIGHERIVALLLEAGATWDAYSEVTPLDIAVEFGYERIVELLPKTEIPQDVHQRLVLSAQSLGFKSVHEILVQARLDLAIPTYDFNHAHGKATTQRIQTDVGRF